MINYLKKKFVILLSLKIYLILNKKKIKQDNYEYNFANIEFIDEIEIKNSLMNNLYSKNIINFKKNYNYHCFDWLTVSKKIGGGENINKSKNYLINWQKLKFKKYTFIWDSFFISKRLINMIYNYDFYAVSSSNKEKGLFHLMILEHYYLLNFFIKINKNNNTSIEELKAILLVTLIYKKDHNYYLNILKKIIKFQIDQNGFHKSYNPTQQAYFLNNLYEIKNILLYFRIKVPEELNFKILNMSSLLISLIHNDSSIALFHGANNNFIYKIFEILKQQGDLKLKDLSKIKNGIVNYTDKNKKIFMDIVSPINHPINNNFHASTLAFEFSCLGEKIITNCGSVNKMFEKNPEYLRYSAAHSTITINNTNISELIEKKSFKRIPENIYFNSSDNENVVVWNASHDGYLKNYKKVVKRNIKIFKNQHIIEGQDEIISTKINSKKMSYSIRFHLMPHCSCLITNDKKSILIKTKKKQSWIFKSNSFLKVEESIYVGSGKKIEKNQQIVIYGNIKDIKKIENWSLIKS